LLLSAMSAPPSSVAQPRNERKVVSLLLSTHTSSVILPPQHSQCPVILMHDNWRDSGIAALLRSRGLSHNVSRDTTCARKRACAGTHNARARPRDYAGGGGRQPAEPCPVLLADDPGSAISPSAQTVHVTSIRSSAGESTGACSFLAGRTTGELTLRIICFVGQGRRPPQKELGIRSAI
jgi:hypothetical protein